MITNFCTPITIINFAGNSYPVPWLIGLIPDAGTKQSPLVIWEQQGLFGIFPPSKLRNIRKLYDECKAAADDPIVTMYLTWADVEPVAPRVVQHLRETATKRERT